MNVRLLSNKAIASTHDTSRVSLPPWPDIRQITC